MREQTHIDANVILRFLLADHKEHSPKARKLFERAERGEVELFVSHVCLAETAWVLTSFYKTDRAQVASKLKAIALHAGVSCDVPEVLITAFDSFSRVGLDFIDCYNAALAESRGAKLASFDKDYRKFPDLKREVI